ncbi:MAG: class I SAM-dependent DNA methyltransferase [Rhizobiaceae bacterium]|jgi:predicted TPR repeat methyltransferase
MTTERRRALDLVYSASTQAELHDAYSLWANEYDRETAELGYGLPFLIGAWVARYVPRGDGPILDAGCGTGLSGPYLKALGYDHIEGLDMSAEMLRLARGRNVYRALKQADLGGQLPWADGHFAAFLSTGVFTEGHAPASSLDELVRITQRGGHAIFTVRDTVLETGGFRAMFAKMEETRRWRPIEESPPFRAFAVGEPEVQVQAFVFEVL